MAESDLKTITISCEKDQILNLSEFADSIEIIPLETRDDNLIGWVQRIVSANDCYFLSSAVSHYTQELYVFGKDGRFIRQIGQEGEAPNAYLGMNDFVLTDDSIIKISENYNLACYDVNGNFLYKRKQKNCPLEIISFNNLIYGLNILPSSHDNQLLKR
ncbi:MAG: 6-bladed beta-propeller [Bacteroides sp.]|nr:6-bladed beta-propeller [Bacteroides sp.]